MKPKRNHKNWTELDPILIELAGTISKTEIAKRLNVSVSSVANRASNLGISLRVRATPPKPTTTKRKPFEARPVTEDDLDSASQLLRKHGYTVLRPDPFRDLKTTKHQRTGA